MRSSPGVALWGKRRFALWDLHALLVSHVDFTNRVSRVALTALLLTLVNTITNLLKVARDRPRLRLEAMVEGPNRCSFDEISADGDGVTLTRANALRKRQPPILAREPGVG